MKSRLLAFLVHLSLSFIVVSLTLCVIIFLWYPPPLFQIQGLTEILLIIVGVDVVLGPTLTLVVYKKGKPSLKFDLTVIALIQVSALAYGSYSTFIARPVNIVFYGDRFEVVCVNEYPAEIKGKVISKADRDFSLTGPKWVGAAMPSDPKEKERIMFSAVIGGGLKLEPEYYVPFKSIAKNALSAGKKANEILSAKPDAKSDKKKSAIQDDRIPQPKQLEAWLQKLNKPVEKIVLIPLKGTPDYGLVALDADNGTILGATNIDPWWYQ